MLAVNEEVEEDWEEDGDKSSDNDGGKMGTKSFGQPTVFVVPRHNIEWKLKLSTELILAFRMKPNELWLEFATYDHDPISMAED